MTIGKAGHFALLLPMGYTTARSRVPLSMSIREIIQVRANSNIDREVYFKDVLDPFSDDVLPNQTLNDDCDQTPVYNQKPSGTPATRQQGRRHLSSILIKQK